MRAQLRTVLGLVGLFTAAAAVTAVLALTGVAHGGGNSSPSSPVSSVGSPNGGSGLIPAPTPIVQTVPSSEQTHYVPGPYLTEAQATAIAVQVAERLGPGPVTILSAQLESVAAASQATGIRVASFYTGSDRMVWLVWLIGTYQSMCQVSGPCPAKPQQVYFTVVDAKTGQSYGAGINMHAPGIPQGY